jgi:GNAT superfamily N-acetyltransferase
VRLRLADPADAEAVADTLREAFAGFEPLYTPAAFRATTPTAAELRARWHEGPVWVAENAGGVVGTVSAVLRSGELYVRSMAVKPAAQGRGAGGALLQEVERFGVVHGAGRMALSTTPFLAAAIRLYERCGFQRAGNSDLFGTPLLLMVKEIGLR